MSSTDDYNSGVNDQGNEWSTPGDGGGDYSYDNSDGSHYAHYEDGSVQGRQITPHPMGTSTTAHNTTRQRYPIVRKTRNVRALSRKL